MSASVKGPEKQWKQGRRQAGRLVQRWQHLCSPELGGYKGGQGASNEEASCQVARGIVHRRHACMAHSSGGREPMSAWMHSCSLAVCCGGLEQADTAALAGIRQRASGMVVAHQSWRRR